MLTKTLRMMLVGALLAGATAAGAEEKRDEKKVYNGPVKQTFGQLDLILDDGASAEVQYQPDASQLVVKTLAKEARVVTSARFLLLVENVEGTVEVLLPTGRKVSVEPNHSDIFGRALVDDPGQLTVRIASTAQVTVLEGVPAAALTGIVTTPTAINPTVSPRPETTLSVTPTRLSKGFGTTAP